MSNKNNVAARLKEYEGVISDTLRDIYGHLPDFDSWLADIFAIILDAVDQRPAYLLELDRVRETQDQDWFLRPDMLAYMAYVDRFAGNFRGVERKIPYLKDLGVSYLHLLSVLKPRAGHNDGGFAIEDYYSVNPKYGTMDDLVHMTRILQRNNISPCIDFVFNHTAMDHQWARKALAGDPYYRDFYYFFSDENTVRDYEAALAQVLPETSPGNFTYFEQAKSWVWPTFYYYQWDLNYRNPNVFREMVKIMLFLANRGIEVFRLDATAYLWKEKGTNCQNLSKTHKLLQAFRAIMSLAAPAVCLKAEAIVGARYITKYLGDPAGERPECQLSYHNALMAALWDSLATGNITRMSAMLGSLPPKPLATSWITYLRCHDEVGWGALTDDRGAPWAAGNDDLKKLNDFYEGKCDNSFARGQAFQLSSRDAFHGTNGTLASLAGLEKAMEEGNQDDIDMALRRIILLYRVIFSFGGIPLIYMGEELGLFNDYGYDKDDPVRDDRWLHRPALPDDMSRGRIFSALGEMARLRKTQKLLHANVPTVVIDSGNAHIFAFTRRNDEGIFLVLANFLPVPQDIDPACLKQEACLKQGGCDRSFVEQFTDRVHNLSQGLTLLPYECLWLKV